MFIKTEENFLSFNCCVSKHKTNKIFRIKPPSTAGPSSRCTKVFPETR